MRASKLVVQKSLSCLPARWAAIYLEQQRDPRPSLLMMSQEDSCEQPTNGSIAGRSHHTNIV